MRKCLMGYNWKTDRVSWIGISLGLVFILLHQFQRAEAVESWYGRGLFRPVRVFLDFTFGLLPLPATYVLFILLVYWVVSRVIRHSLLSFLLKLMGLLGFAIALFYLLWGFNYSRPILEQRMSWTMQTLTADQIREQAEGHLIDLNAMREELVLVSDQNQVKVWQASLRTAAYDLAAGLGYEVWGNRLRSRVWKPVGILLRLGTAGFYNPLTGECNIDGGLHLLQQPYVIAHEYFHGLGVTGEGDCNFLAYIICRQSADPFIRYSGELGYWRYLRSALYRTDAQVFEQVNAKASHFVQSDLQSIAQQMAKFPDIAPRARDAIYDAYLKSNKISDGMASYGRVVGLVINWKLNQEKL